MSTPQLQSVPKPSRKLPTDLAAEAACVGGVLFGGRSALERCLAQPEDFSGPHFSAIWTACREIYQLGRAIDVITVAAQLRTSGKMFRLIAYGEEVFLAQLANEVATVENIAHHDRLVRERAAQRRVLTGASALVDEAYAGVAPDQLAAKLAELQVAAQQHDDELPCTPISEVVAKDINWFWRDRLPFGALSVICGDPGKGKSVLTCALTAIMTRGGVLPYHGDVDSRSKVLLIAHEDPVAQVVKPRLAAAGADEDLVLRADIMPELPRDVPKIARLVRRHKIRLVVIDPLAAYLSAKISSSSDQEVRQALDPLAELAEAEGIAILVVAHLNKKPGSPGLYRIGGSIGIVAKARSALLVGVDPSDPGLRVLCQMKTNLAPECRSLTFALVSTPNGQPRIEWRGDSRFTADSLFAAEEQRGKRDPAAVKKAVEVLRTILGNGPVPATDVEDQAEAAGVAPRTLKRAKTRLGVVSERAGGSKGRWIWRLPDDDEPPAPERGDPGPGSSTPPTTPTLPGIL